MRALPFCGSAQIGEAISSHKALEDLQASALLEEKVEVWPGERIPVSSASGCTRTQVRGGEGSWPRGLAVSWSPRSSRREGAGQATSGRRLRVWRANSRPRFGMLGLWLA